MTTVQEDRQRLREELTMRVLVARKKARRYRIWNYTLLVAALIFGLMATALAADSAKGGKMVAGPVAEATTGKPPAELPKGWRNVCGLIALFTLLGTTASGVHTSLKIAEHQSRATRCLGLLDSLSAELVPDASARREILERVSGDFAGIVKDYADYLH
ncbi:MAG: hypothetical protein HY885_12105 [Deltaproteobacteria bacterium]|nr:hypothetical protein [Deltaproteobacteria bacterium]